MSNPYPDYKRNTITLPVAKHPAQQEPVAWIVWGDKNVPSLTFTKPADKDVFDALYTSPPTLSLAQRTWVNATAWRGPTDEEIEQGCKESWVTEQAWQSAVWWAEAKLKEKNNG